MTASLWPLLKRRRWWVSGFCAVLVPVCYVLSVGPAAFVVERGWLSQGIAETLYRPCLLAVERGWFRALGVEKALDGYVRWWVDQAAAPAVVPAATSSAGKPSVVTP